MEQAIIMSSGTEKLAGTLHLPENREKNAEFPIVIICHGFIGSRVGVNRLFVKAARYFSSLGFAVLRFDYEGCGESSGIYGTYGMERFIEQTEDVIKFAANLPSVDEKEIYLLGHSLGGAVATLTAVRNEKIRKLAIWSAVGRPFEDIAAIVGEEKVEALEHDTFIDFEGYSLMKIFFRSLSEYAPLQEAKNFTGDVLIAHGTEDEEIACSYAHIYEKSFQKSAKSVEKNLIAGGNHTFTSIEHSTEIFRITGDWLIEQRKTAARPARKII